MLQKVRFNYPPNFEEESNFLKIELMNIIVDTYNSGNACFLNFDPKWQQCFTAVIFACDLPGFAGPPEVYYPGKKVQVRLLFFFLFHLLVKII